ncbi:MAG: hypothetical protein ABIG39_01955 [Candidatus Micrarchaeota archaeon]
MKVYLVLAIVALMLFGCSGPSETTSAKKVTPDNEPGASGTTGQNDGGQDSQPANQDIGSKTISEIMGLSVPVVCTIATEEPYGKLDAVAYMKGGSFRYEATITTSEGTQEITLVYKDNAYYTSVPKEIQGQTDCKWIVIESSNSGTGTQAMTADDLKNMRKTDYSCAPGVFGNEKFEVSGKTCTLQDMMTMG